MVSTATDPRKRVDVAEGDEPTAADTHTDQAPRRVSLRMADMRKECADIGKQDIEMKPKEGKPFTIKGHTVEAVLSELRPMLDRHGLGLIPNLVERAYNGNRCDVIIDWEFEGLELADNRVVRWGGAGTDNGDKAYAKACTNSLKEMLKKTFLITDREDAKEETDPVDHKTDEGLRREDLDRAKEERRAALEQWGRTFKAALENARSAKDVGRLQAENVDQLNSPDLPAVTRQFFFDLIQRRKAALKDEADDFPGDRT